MPIAMVCHAKCKMSPQGNPAPIFHKGAFYLATQHTKVIWTTKSINPGSTWSVFANVSFADVPKGARPEDPFMCDIRLKSDDFILKMAIYAKEMMIM